MCLCLDYCPCDPAPDGWMDGIHICDMSWFLWFFPKVIIHHENQSRALDRRRAGKSWLLQSVLFLKTEDQHNTTEHILLLRLPNHNSNVLEKDHQ